jgi:hypothetical protein
MSTQQPPRLEGKARDDAFKLIWRDTHKDYRGKLADGSLSILGWAKYGHGLVTAASISDAELAERLEAAKRRSK